MRRLFRSLLVIGCLAELLAAQPQVAPVRKTIAISHVTVIDPKTASLKSDMTVLIRGRRIVAISASRKVRSSPEALTIDGAGKFLIPGLWDMHVHLDTDDFDKLQCLRLFIVNGVTGIRIMNGRPEFHDWRREIEQGKLLGPRMIIASTAIAGPSSFASGAVKVTTIEEARAAVRKAKQDGADFIKVHDGLSRPAYFAIIDEAKKLRLTVAGHVPESITAKEAAEAGQESIEHFTGLSEPETDPAKADALIPVFRRNQTWLCPTLIMRKNYAVLDDPTLADDPRLRYLNASWKAYWQNLTNTARNIPATEWAARRETVRREEALIGRFQRAGIGILAGTDTSNPYVMPGFGLHDELAMLVESQLTPMQALQTATINPAKFFKQPGAIERGAIADLVLLDANPLQDIKNLEKISAVIVQGRVIDRPALDTMLAEIETAARKN
jgi:imidazolonepropionase-like amidohydrolase